MKKSLLVIGVVVLLSGIVMATTFSSVISDWALFYDNVTVGTGDISVVINGSTGNISTTGNISAGGVICDQNGCIGASNNPFNQSLNTLNNVRFNRLGIGVTPLYPLHYTGSLSGTPVFYAIINATAGITPGFRFDIDIPSSSADAGTIAGRVVYGVINSKKDRSGTSQIEGMYLDIGSSDVAQTKGTRNYFGYYSKMGFTQNTGGTTSMYGNYVDYSSGPLVLSGSPTYNLYGSYIKGTTPILDIASGTVNRYGIYLTGWNKGTYDDVSYGIYSPDSAIRMNDYYSGDGTQGMTGTCTIASISTITVKDGLITGCS